jgi:atypical dual specificity phosphatase
LNWVIKHGIKCVITREHPLKEKWLEGCDGVEYRHLQVKDYDAPSLHQLVEIVDYIDDKIRDNKPVIVHCNGGTGRTGTILSAYLMKKHKQV